MKTSLIDMIAAATLRLPRYPAEVHQEFAFATTLGPPSKILRDGVYVRCLDHVERIVNRMSWGGQGFVNAGPLSCLYMHLLLQDRRSPAGACHGLGKETRLW